MRDGLQLFSIDYNVLDDTNLKNKIKYIKIIIKSAFGGDKTYINQIMLYENSIQEMNNGNNINESIRSINNNNFQQEINLPEDLSNSQISINSNEVKKIQNKNLNDNIRDKNNLEKKIKKKNIVDYISETNSKHSDINNINKNNNKIKQNESIKVEENNININDNTNNENNEEEENEENEESNQIIPTSNELESPYINKYERNYSKKNNNNLNEIIKKEINIKKTNVNNDDDIKINKSKKVQKLEKILKQNILKCDYNKINQNNIYLDNLNRNKIDNFDRNEKNNNNYLIYKNNKTINNIKDYPSLTPIINNNYNTQNNNNNNERDSNIEDNNIQKYFKINANTPNRFTVNGYEYLINKKRPNTPKLNEINMNRNTFQPQNKNINNEFKNKTTMEGFIKNHININDDIKKSKAYETLEMQLQDMEKHLENMALNRNTIIPISNNNFISKTNRENKLDINNKYYNNDIHINNNYIDKKNKNQSMISNASSYLNDEQKNINTNLSNNIYNNSNNNYFNKYNSPNLNLNNDEDSIEINKRIDNLEKNIFEIKDELNNISSHLKIFLNKDNFLYNFSDSIKQICYDYFNERMNMEKNEQVNDGNENLNEERENSQYSGEYSEEKNIQNENNKIEEEINKKIDQKLEYLCDNLKNQIFEKYLQPSINEIEKSMRQNIEDIKEKVDSINYINNSNQIKKNNKYYNNITDEEENNNNIYNGSLEIKNSNEESKYKGNIYKNSSKRKKDKYEEINRLGEKLYGKLLEKEKKLKMLKEETMKNIEK